MKKRLIAFLLCFAMVMPILPVSAAVDLSVKNDGAAVTSVTLPIYEKEEISVDAGDTMGVAGYQWQILVPGANLWVDITGANGQTLELSYAMVASLLSGDSAQVRCRVVTASGDVYTDIVTVEVDESEPEAAERAEAADPVVLKEAEVVDGPVVIPAEESDKETEAPAEVPAVEPTETSAQIENTVSVEDAKAAYEAAAAEEAAAKEAYDAAAAVEAEAKAALDAAQTAYDSAVAALAVPAETAAATEPAETVAEETSEADAATEPAETEAAAEPAAPAETVSTLELDEANAAYAVAVARTAEAKAAYEEAAAKASEAKAAYDEAVAASETAAAETVVPKALARFSLRKASASDVSAVADEPETKKTYIITLQYMIEGTNKEIADSHFAEVMEGSSYSATVKHPTVLGYAPIDDDDVYVIDIDSVTEAKTFVVYYTPVDVDYIVKHYQQDVSLGENYNLVDTEKKQGKTGSYIPDVHKTYDGFAYLLYERPTIAADGSTVVEIKYNRRYTLINFDLDGGYGVEPIYAAYGTAVPAVSTPTKAGYKFEGWTLDGTNVVALPTTVPAQNVTYKAKWTANDTAKVSVVFWGENADDEEYSYLETKEVQVKPGTEFTYSENGMLICALGEHSHGETCYQLTCTTTVHTHSDECYTCNQESHTHNTSCYDGVGGSAYPGIGSNPTGNGYIARQVLSSNGKVIYINGSWYEYTGTTSVGNVAPSKCGKTESTHTHNDSCLGCGLTPHEHSELSGSCYKLTCTETVHTHDSKCYTNGAGLDSAKWKFVSSDTVTVAADGSTVVNVYYDRVEYSVRFYSNSSLTDEYTNYKITAKWGENILDEWPEHEGSSSWLVEGKSNTWQNSIQVMPVGGAKFWGPKTGSSNYSAYYYVEALPGDTNTIQYNGVAYKLHHTDTTVSSGNVSDEEKYGIEGFTYKEGTPNGSSYINAKFYYTRNSYNLTFNDGYKNVKTESVKYEAPLSTYNDYKPDVPSAYEPGSVEFGGWYLNPECTGVQYDLTKHTMPADNVLLYAKWVPVNRTVEFYLDKDAYTSGTKLSTHPDITVPHGTLATPTPVDPENGAYEFVGWFYMDGETEKAMDFENMPIRKNLKVYGKWSSNVEKEFTVYYKIEGTDTEVADKTWGKGLVDNTKTFDAKLDMDLYADYREGYFPDSLSKSITLNIEDENSEGSNTCTFWYKKAVVPYTVRYLNKETGQPVAPEKKVEDNGKAYVTETFVPVQGLLPDAYQKSLALSLDMAEEDRVITFYYAEDATRAYYSLTHWKKNANGAWERFAQTQNIGNIDVDKIEAQPTTLDGYIYDSSLTESVVVIDGKESITPYSGPVLLTSNGLEIRHYYVEEQVDINYVAVGPQGAVNFGSVDPASEKVDIFTGLAKGSTATAGDGYEFVGWYSDEACTNRIHDQAQYTPTRPAAGWVESTFYAKFVEQTVTINYEVVGPDGCGTVTPESETLEVFTGVAQGSTAAPSSNLYRFVGWYTDEACEHAVTETNGTLDGTKFTPAKVDNKNVAATYYAKFEYNLTNLTITKTLTETSDKAESFIFSVKGTGVDLNVVIKVPANASSESITISGLTVGDVITVTENSSYNRDYSSSGATASITLVAEVDGATNNVTISNSPSGNKWLSESGHAANHFRTATIVK